MQPALTAKQRKILDSIPGVRRVNSKTIEIYIAEEGQDYADDEKTDAALKAVQDAGVHWGGYRTGYGAWSLHRDSAPADDADFNEPWSRHHY